MCHSVAGAGKRGADIYLWPRFSLCHSFAIVTCLCVSVWHTDRPQAGFTPDLVIPSPWLLQWEQMARTYPAKNPSNTHTCTHNHGVQELPWRRLICLPIQQWVIMHITMTSPHKVSAFVCDLGWHSVLWNHLESASQTSTPAALLNHTLTEHTVLFSPARSLKSTAASSRYSLSWAWSDLHYKNMSRPWAY